MSLDFNRYDDFLSITYSPYNSSVRFVFDDISEKGFFELKKTFKITKKSIVIDSEDDFPVEQKDFIEFRIANVVTLEKEKYYQVDKEVLNINFDIFIHTACKVTKKYFLTSRKLSIFRILNDEIGLNESIIVGGTNENAISENEYLSIIQALPTNTELTYYDYSRVCTTLKCFFSPQKDQETLFNKFVKSKELDTNKISEIHFEDFDIRRYSFLLTTLEEMLANAEKYSENNWQDEILKFIKILFPKYVISAKEAIIRKGIASKEKNIDILLGDFNGNIDIIEIKKPYGIELLNKSLYRENYIPTRALSGAIMQSEKYIYYLTKGGEKAENDLNKQFEKTKPADYKFKIVNPKSIIIMGRTKDYDNQQKEDLEIIRRKYKNVVDIISYDDLLQRLKITIEMLQKEQI